MVGNRLSRVWSGLRKFVASIARRLPGVFCDLAGFAGAGCLAYGARLIYEPAGFLVAGVLLMVFALLIGRRLDARKE